MNKTQKQSIEDKLDSAFSILHSAMAIAQSLEEVTEILRYRCDLHITSIRNDFQSSVWEKVSHDIIFIPHEGILLLDGVSFPMHPHSFETDIEKWDTRKAKPLWKKTTITVSYSLTDIEEGVSSNTLLISKRWLDEKTGTFQNSFAYL